MKQKKKILWMLLPVLIFVGCGTQDSILKRGQPETGSLEEQQDTETVYNVESETQNEKPEQEEKSLQEWIYVDVCGAVRNPGVYRIEAGSRVFQVLEQAGGCTEEASLETVNQARLPPWYRSGSIPRRKPGRWKRNCRKKIPFWMTG